MLTLRIAIMLLIWASALLAPAAADEVAHSPGAQISYTYHSPDFGSGSPGPTDPTGPSS
jgi:hypothetical protein